MRLSNNQPDHIVRYLTLIPLFLLSGEYDYSCTSEGTLDIDRRTGAEAVIMKELGHFPMSENPEKFIGYLLPVLDKIRAS